MLQDQARVKVARKSPQCGVSENCLVWAFACLDQGYNVFYVWPNETLRNQFANDRVNPTINLTDRYRRLVEAASDRVGKSKVAEGVVLKHVGNAAMAMIVSGSKPAFRSFAADAAIIEEVDECDQQNLRLVNDRFGASDYRQLWYLGNPTVEDFGIDKLYKSGDQKSWVIRCDHCNDRQPLDWFKNVVDEVREGVFETYSPDGYEIVCRSCHKPLNRLGPGEWVAAYPGREISSYHISKLFSGSVPVDELGNEFKKALTNLDEYQAFYNAVLGLAYTPKKAKLSFEMLRRSVADFPRESTGEGCFLGVDVGSLLHYVVLDRKSRVVAIGEERDFEKLDDLMESYGAVAVVDGLPEARKAQEFADRFRNRVWICDKYDAVPRASMFVIHDETSTVRIDRTVSMDNSHADIIRQVITFPRDAESIKDSAGSLFFDQLIAPTRVWDPERRIHIWTKGRDHWRHALNYATIAREIRAEYGSPFVISVGGRSY